MHSTVLQGMKPPRQSQPRGGLRWTSGMMIRIKAQICDGAL